jgi:hypothetical protein
MCLKTGRSEAENFHLDPLQLMLSGSHMRVQIAAVTDSFKQQASCLQ